MELNELFSKYRSATLDLIKALENDEDGQEFLLIREEMLTLLKSGSYCKSEAKRVFQELEIDKVDALVNEEVRRTQQRIKVELVKIKQQRNVRDSYGTAFKNINFINKKI